MARATESERIIYYNKKSLKPFLTNPDSNWQNSLDLILEWKYIGIDIQSKFIIQIAEDELFKTVVILKEFTTARNYVKLSQLDDLEDGVYYWRVKVLGTQASEFSDFSDYKKLKIDSNAPVIDSVDIAYISNNVEFHSNTKRAIGNVEFDEGIFISSDDFTESLLIEFSDPFDSDLTEDNIQNRSRKRTYFIEAYFPELDSSSNVDIFNHPDIYIEKGLRDQDNVLTNTFTNANTAKLNFPKISGSLYIHNQSVNSAVSQRDYPQSERWWLSFPHHNLVIIKIFYFDEDYIYNTYNKYLVQQNNQTSFHRKWTWDSLMIESFKNEDFIFRNPLIAKSLIKIGSNLTPPTTYSVNEPSDLFGLPKYCFAIGLDGIKKLELLDNSYYSNNSNTKNSIRTVGSSSSTNITSDIFVNLDSDVFNNIKPGDILVLSNSHFSYNNYPTTAVDQFDTYRNFKNTFEIKSVNADQNKITVLGFNDYLRFTNEIKPGLDGSTIQTYSGTIEYNSDIDTTTLTTENAIFGSLVRPSDSGTQIGNHSLSNFFVGIENSDGEYQEFCIIDNNAGTLHVKGNILSKVGLEDGNNVNFYISGDTFSIFNNALFINNNNIKIFTKTSNNISGIKGIKVLETIPTSNLSKKSISEDIITPTNIRYNIIENSSVGKITGSGIFRYNIVSVDENGLESEESDTITFTLPSVSKYYYINFSWDQVPDAQSYRIYGRTGEENERTILSEIKFNSSTKEVFAIIDVNTGGGGTVSGRVSWNDYGVVNIPTYFSGDLGAPTGLSSVTSINPGFISAGTYYYEVVAFQTFDDFSIEESQSSSTYLTLASNNSKVDLTWNSVPNADGYRIYGRTETGKTLISTIYGNEKTSYSDPGIGSLSKLSLLDANRSFTRTNPSEDDSGTKYNTATAENGEEHLTTGEDIKSIDYTIRNKTEEVVDFYFRVVSNAGLESDYTISLLKTASIIRRLEKNSIIIDAIKPIGDIKVFNNELFNTEDSRVVLDYTNLKSPSDPLLTAKFSNYSGAFYTNPEPASSGFRSWKLGFDVASMVDDIGEIAKSAYWKENETFGSTPDGDHIFHWAKIPLVNSIKENSPISVSSINNFIPDIIGKKTYIGSKAEDSESVTCLDVTYDFANDRYIMLAKIKDLAGDSLETYLQNNIFSNREIISTTTEFKTDDVESFTGLNCFLVNIDKNPYRIISYPTVDFKEENASDFNQSSLGEFDRLQYNISDLLQVDSEYFEAYWTGNIYVSLTGDYVFSAGIRGDISLYIDENVDKYYNYLNVTDAKKSYKSFDNIVNNVHYKVWTVQIDKAVSDDYVPFQDADGNPITPQTSDTYIEHIAYSGANPDKSLVNSGTVRLERGWHRIRLKTIYKRSADTELTSNYAMSLFKSSTINTHYTDEYPTIESIDASDNSITCSFSNDFEFEDNSLVGSLALIGIRDPNDGTLLSGNSEVDANNLEGTLLDGGVISNNGLMQRYLRLTGADVSDDFDLSTGDHFDFIQPDIRSLNFAPVRDVIEGEDGSKIIVVNEQEIPIFQFSGESASKYRICKWLLKIKGNIGNKIEFVTPVEGEIQSISVDEDNNTTTITSEGIGLDYYQLDFYGYPVILDYGGSNETVMQGLLISENSIQLNGIIPTYSIEDDDLDSSTGLYPHETNYLNTTMLIGDITQPEGSEILSVDDIFYINLGQAVSPFVTDHLIKNALPVYSKIADRFGNERTSKTFVGVKTSFDSTSGTNGAFDNAVIEYYISGANSGKINSITILGEQAFDANIVDESVGIYESDVIVGGTGFAFWKSIGWTTSNTLQNATDVQVEVRTGKTEEECKKATWNRDAFGIDYPAFTLLEWDYPSDSPISVNINSFTTDGSVDRNNKTIKNKYLQFRITLTSNLATYTPKVNTFTVTYTTGNSVLLFTKNFSLSSNIVRGLLTANTSIPTGTRIEWGINTDNETDFEKYYKINLNEVFSLPEDVQNDSFRLAALLTSSDTDVPKIYDIAFQFELEDGEELLNLNL